MINNSRIFRVSFALFLLLLSGWNVELWAQSTDIHQNLCKGGSRLVSSQANVTYYRWHIVNQTTGAEVVQDTNTKEYTFTMPDANDVYEVYVQTRNNTGQLWNTSNSVIMYPYDFPDAVITVGGVVPAGGVVEYTGNVLLEGSASGAFPSSNPPITIPLDINYGWYYNSGATAVESGSGSTDTYNVTNEGYYEYRLYDSHSRVSGCSSSVTVLASEETVFTINVCEGSFATGDMLLDYTGIAEGLRDNGTWLETSGLVFSDFGSNPIITGFVSGTNYLVKWSRNPAKIYSFNLVTGPGGSFEFQNESGTTSDVILCTGSHTFTVVPGGDTHTYIMNNLTDGTTTELATNVTSNSYAFTSPNPNKIYELYAIVKDGPCYYETNRIKVSADEDVEIRVVGEKSVCDGDFNFELEVIPYDSNYGYTWRRNGVVVGTGGQFLNVATYGNGTYTVDVVGCAGLTYNSDPVVVNNYTLPAALISPPGSAIICPGNTETLSGYMDGAHPTGAAMSYEWFYNGSSGLASGPGSTSTLNVGNTGDYEFKIYETNNPLCYSVSPVTTLSEVELAINSFSPNGTTTFCGATIASATVEASITGAVGQISVTIENTTTGSSQTVLLTSGTPLSVPLGILTSTNTFKITAVSGGGCSMDATEINAIPEITFTKETDPLVYNITGSNSCGPEEIGLDLSEPGVNYYLYRNNVYVAGSEIAGTGLPISFGTQSVGGTYTVKAERPGCENLIDMNGQVIVSEIPLLNLTVTLNGSGCAGTAHTITIGNTQTDVYYSLYRNGTLYRTARIGTGGDLSFSGIVVDGTYTVMVDRGQCHLPLDNSVFIAPQPALQTVVETVGCAGVDFYVVLNGSESGVEYTITNAGGIIIETISGDGNPVSFTTPLTTLGVYTISASNVYGCSRIIDTVELLAQPTQTYVLSTAMSPACSGLNHTLTLSGSQLNVTYRLYRNNTTGAPLVTVPGTGVSISFGSQSVAGTYLVTADNGGCEITLPTQLVMYQQPTIYNVIPGTFCENDDVTITLSNSQSSVTYYLLRDGVDYGSDQTGLNGSAITFGPEKYPPGTYTIRGSAGGCYATMSGSVTVNSNPIINIPNLASSYCADAGSVTVTGSPANANGSWNVVGYSPLPNHFTDNGNGTLTFDVGAVVGQYGQRTFTIGYTYTDPNGCDSHIERSSLFQEDISNVVRFENLPAISCQTETTPIVLQAYLNYSSGRVNITSADGLFSGPGIVDNGDGTADFTPSVAGNGLHTVNYNYTDPVTGCSGSYSQQVQIGTTLTINGMNPVYCLYDGVQTWSGDPAGGTLIVYDAGGTKLAETTGSYNFNPSVSGAGSYTVEYNFTDGGGCVNQFLATVVVEAELNASFTTSSGITQFCVNAGSVDLVPAAGSSPGGFYHGPGVSTNKFNPAVAGVGTHTIFRTITTANCTDTKPLTVTVIDLPALSIDNLSNSYCENNQLSSGPVLIEASNKGIAGAVYTFEATTNAIGRSPLYTLVGGVRTYATSITADQVYFDPAYVQEGNYIVRLVFDNSANNGCVTSVQQNVEVYDAPEVNFGGVADPLQYCQSVGTVTLQGSFVGGGLVGAGDFSGAGILNDPAGDGIAVFDPLLVLPGTHPVTYTYITTDGCSTSRTKDIEVLDSPTVYNITPSSAIANSGNYCEGSAGVTIGVDFSQNGITYELILNNNFAAPVQTKAGDGDAITFDNPVTVTGNYTVRAVTATGCSSMMNGSVQVIMNKVAAAISTQNVSCNLGSDGEITITASGGSVPYVYQISTDGGSTFTNSASNVFTNLVAGTYHIQVTDAIGCELPAAVEVVISEPAASLALVSTTVPVGCLPCIDGGDCDGSATITISGGTPFADLVTYPTGYDIEWRDAANVIVGNGLSINNKTNGSYTVTVTDSEGCTVIKTVTIGLNSPLSLTENLPQHINVVCHGSSTGQFEVQAAGGSGAYEFSLDGVNWFSGTNVYLFTGLPADTYQPYVRDAAYARCVYPATPVVISEPDALTLTEVAASHVDVDCFGGATGQLEVMATGGSNNFEYTIDNGANWVPDPLFTGLKAGTYYIWVRDFNATSCVHQSVVVDIQQSTGLKLVPDNVKHVTCSGGNDGSISVTASGGSGNYSYSIDGGTSWQTDALFDILVAGTYNISVRDEAAANCELIDAVTITVNEPQDYSILEDLAAHQDVSCKGGNNGSFTVTPSRTGSFQYSVDGVTWQVSPVFSNLSAGGYQVSVRDMNTAAPNYCVKTNILSITISEPALALTVGLVSSAPVSCLGGNDGVLEVDASGGTAPYSYQWYRVTATGNIPLGAANTGNTNQATNLIAGKYRVIVTDDKGCQESDSYDIIEPTTGAVISVFDLIHVTTVGGSDGAIEIAVTGGSTPYQSIVWSGVDLGGAPVPGLVNGNYRQENLVAGVYEVTVTDANGCTATFTNMVVSQPGMNLGFVITSTNPGPCNGASNGTINLSAVGGTVPYQSIELTNSSGTTFVKNSSGNNYANYSGLAAGTYIATVVDANNVSATETIVLIEPDAINFDFEKIKDVTCNGEANGTIRFNITGGTPNPADTGGDPLIPDNPYYSVLLVPSSGASRSMLIEENTNTLISDLVADASYQIIVEDANLCSDDQTFTITEPLPLILNETKQSVSCYGGADGEIAVAVSGRAAGTPFIYNWQQFDGTNWVDYELNGNALLSGLSAGSYRVTVIEMATLCEVTSSAYEITQPVEMVVQAIGSDVATCKGDNSGSIEVTVSGGVAPYLIDYGIDTKNGDGPVFNLTALPAGPYVITVTDNNGVGCVKTANVIISEPLQPLTVINFDAVIDCETANTGEVNFEVFGGVTNAANEYSYTVSLVNQDTGTNYGFVVGPTAVLPYAVNIPNLPAGNYVLTVSDRLATASANCSPYTRDFNLQHINVLADVVNATCSGVNTGEIKNIVIEGGSGNYVWNWSSPDGGLGINNANLNQTGLSAGTYVLELNDLDRGCTVIKTYDVLFDYDLQITGTTKAVSCAGVSDGAIYNVNVTGASDPNLVYTWSGPDIGTVVADPANPDISGLAGGSYILTVTDGNGCTTIATFNVAVPAPIQFDLTTSLDNCDPYSRSITMNNLSGGTGNLSFIWNGPGSFSTTNQNITGLTLGGTYTVTVFDENMCQEPKSITIPGAIQVDASIQHLLCSGENNGGIVLHVTGGSGNYSYLWSTADGSGISANLKDQENLTAGTYTVVVTDNIEMVSGLNCSVTKSFVVTQPNAILVTGNKTDVLCAGNNNGTITLDVVGGSGSYSYNWSSANGTGLVQGVKDQTGLSGGTYSVLVSDANGCNAVANFTINEPDALDFTISYDDTNCTGYNRIEISNQTGGSGTYALSWAGPGIPSGFTGTLQENLPGGIYIIRMTDTGVGALCTVEKSVTLTKALQVSAVTTPETCPGQQDGTITLTVTNGLAPYTYNWTSISGSPVVAANKNQSGLAAGDYHVQVTDARGCNFDLDVTINNLHILDVVGAVTNVTCNGASTGAIDLTVAGGSGDYSYLWNSTGFTETTQDITGLTAGSYAVVVTDNVYGCQVTEVFPVTQPATPITVVSADITPVLCYGNATGEIDITVTGGTAPYSYQWSTTSGAVVSVITEDQTGLIAGDYQVRITDARGCYLDAGPYTVIEPALPLSISLIDQVHVTIPGESTGAIEVDVTGGTGNYNYLWEQTSPATAVIPGSVARQENLAAGVYQVTVTDDNGCSDVLDNINITEPGQALAINHTSQNVRPCYGSNNGAIQLQVVGGTPDMGSGSATYHIVMTRGAVTVADVNDVSLAVNPLEAGFYSVVVTDANGVTATKDIEITQPPLMLFDVDVVNHVTCYGGSDAVIRVNVSGGAPAVGGNYQVRLLGPGVNITRVTNGVNEDFTGLPIGNYTVVVWDDADGDGVYSSANNVEDDCSKSQNITITQPEAVATLSVVTGSEEVCEGILPQLQIIVTGWTGIAANPLVATLNDGTVVTVNDSPFIFQPATAPASGSYTYTITSLVADGTTCSKGYGTGNALVTVHPLPTGRIIGNARICEGETAQLAVELTGNAPWSITYTDGTNVWSENNINSALHLIAVNPTVSSTYQLIAVADAYCSNAGTGTATVLVDELPVVNLSGLNPVICRGGSANLTFTFTAGAGPWLVTWQEIVDVGGTPVVTNQSQTMTVSPTIVTVNPSFTTTYKLVSVTDANGGNNNCLGSVGSQEVVVTVNQLPAQPAPIVGPFDVCQGTTHTFSVPAINYAVGYVWELPTGATIISGSGTRTIEVYFDAATSTSGYLRVRGTNSCGQGLTREMYVNVNQLPAAIGPIAGSNELCQGTTRAAYSIAPVADATGYNWVVPAGFTIQGQGTADILVDIDPNIDSFTGQITVTPYNDCGSSLATEVIDITVYPLPVANAGFDDEICSNSYTLNADPLPGGWTGYWEVVPGMGSATILNPTSPTANVTNISRGDVTFRWTVTHSHAQVACSVSDEVVIRNNTLAVNAVALQSLVCNGEAPVSGTPVPAGYINTSGLWEAVFPVGSAASFDDATAHNTTVRNLEPGLNRLRWSLIQNGCVSYAEIEIMNNQPDQAVINGLAEIDLCTDVVTLSANVPVAGKGTGQWSIVQGFGSFSSLTDANITITNLAQGTNIFRWTITKGACSTFADVVVRNNQLVVDAGRYQLICTDNTILNGTQPPAGTSGQWSVVTGGAVLFADGNLYNTAVSNLGFDDTVLRWTITNRGCESFDEVTITSNRPTTAEVGSAITVCGTTANLTGNAAIEGTGVWSVVSGSGKFTDPFDPVTEVTGLGFGTNVFRWTITKDGCSSSADLTVNNQLVYVNAGKDTIICGRVTQLHGNIPETGTGQWRLVEGMGGATFLPGPNVPNPMVGGLAYGNNGFIWTIAVNGCVSRDTVVVVNNAPYPVEAGGNQIVDGAVATLQATPPVIFDDCYWELISGGGDIVDPTDPYTQVTNLRRGDNVFRWTVTKGHCSEFDEVTITNGETIDANAGRDQEVCTNTATLQANDPDVAIGKWSVVSGSGTFADVYDPNTTVKNLSYGENIFRWTIYYSLTQTSDEVVITNNSPDQANAGYDDVVCGTEFQLRGNMPIPDRGDGLWTLFTGGGIFNDATLPNPMVSDLGPGENRFIYTITKGICVSSDTVSIINGLPTEAFAGNDDTICVNYVNLKPNIPTYGTGSWRVGSVGAARFDGNWARDLASGPNILIWGITTGYCTSTDTITIVNNEPSEAYAGQNRDICDTTITLSATPPIYGTGSWEVVFGSGNILSPTEAQTEVTGLAQGENYFRWTVDNNGCTSVSDVIIRNNLVDAHAGGEQVLCSDTTTLEANNPLPGVGTWGVLGGSGSANFDDLNDPYTTVRNLDQGENLLTWTILHKGCPSVSVVSITNNNPTKANAGFNDATCEDYYVLAANQPEIGTATWSIREGGGQFSSYSDPSAKVDSLKFGTNIFRWTIQHENCASYADVKIEFNRIDAVAGSDRTICATETVLEANNALPGVGTWSIPGGQGAALFADSNVPTTRVSNLRKGENMLRWTINNKGCITYDDVVITNDLPSEAYAGNTQTFCDNTTQLDATPVTIGTGRWSVVAGSAHFTDELNPKTIVTNLAQGENLLIWTVSNGLCSLQDQVVVVNNLPSEPYAGLDYEEVCENSFQLKAAKPDYGIGQWSFIDGGGTLSDFSDPHAFITFLDHGTNRLRWTVSAGQCSLSDEVVIENNTPTKANAGPDIEDCKDRQVLDGNIPEYGSGVWERISGYGDFVNSVDPKTPVENLGFGPNIFRWHITKGNCHSSDEVVVFNKIPDKAAAGGEQTLCENYTVLNANDPLTGIGTWSVVKGKGSFDNPNAYNSRVVDVGFGENIFQWRINYGECETTDEVVVVNNKALVYAGEDQVVYEPSAVLNANNAGNLDAKWYVVGTSSAEFEDPTFFNTQVSNLSEGINTFRWEIVVNKCVVSDEVSVDYRMVPDADFITDVSDGCYPLSVNFTNYSVGGSVYHWDFGDGDSSGDRNPEHTFATPGLYTVTLRSPGPDGNDGISTKVIEVFDHPYARFEVNPDLVYVPGDKARFYDLSVDAVQWFWQFGDGNSSTLRNPSHEYQDAGLFDVSLRVTNEHGCVDSTTVEDAVTAELAGFIKFPTAFRPRPGASETGTEPGMEYSVVFKPVYRDVDTYLLQIFNRWGQLIFESTDINAGWDGMYQGQLATQAVYIFKASGKYVNGREYRETGSFLLVR